MAVITDVAGPPSALFEQERSPRVAVLYASASGSTAGIARRIADRLRDAGTPVDVWPVEEADGVDSYAALVLGSAVYGGAWLPSAAEFARDHADELQRRPVWLFSVGALDGPPRSLERAAGLTAPDADELTRTLGAVEHRRFAGLLERRRWPWWRRVWLRLAGGRFGDRRDWSAIDAWTVAIAEALHGQRTE
ncbi:MAG TPA: flavodoxin domain-containing protein [Capillimicrobium sp.]|nr:flavodoxin domain-containing protein [Capillimicrobium sp.]